MLIFLFTIAAVNLCLLILSVTKLRNSGDKTMFTFAWSSIIGAFVWEDVVVLSGFFLLSTLFTIAVRDIRIGLLLLSCFWIVRAAGEALYQFLEQFFQPKHAPHDLTDLVRPLHRLFGDISMQKCFILLQVMWQVLCTVAIASLVLLVIYWQKIPAW